MFTLICGRHGITAICSTKEEIEFLTNVCITSKCRTIVRENEYSFKEENENNG